MTSSSLPLSGKRALVTGGSRGIGAAIARRLAADGADVAITYEKSADVAEALAEEIRASGRKAAAIQADAGAVAGATAAIDGAVAALGGLDILVNNAGIGRMGDFADQPLEEIEAQLNVNVRGVMLTTQAALKHIPEGGRVITIGSNVGEKVPFGGLAGRRDQRPPAHPGTVQGHQPLIGGEFIAPGQRLADVIDHVDLASQ